MDCDYVGTYEEQQEHHAANGLPCGNELIAVGANYYPAPKDWHGYAIEVDGRHIKITDPDCPDLVFQRIRNWVNKTNIKHLGDNTLLSMYESGLIKDIPDLYRTSIGNFANVNTSAGNLGHTMASKIMGEIDQTRELDIGTFMGSLSIKFLGRSMVDHIGYSTPQEFIDATVLDLSNKDNMGVNKAADMHKSIQNRKTLILELLKYVNIKAGVVRPSDGRCSDMVLCFTGVRPSSEEQSKFESLGGQIKSCVSKNTTHLVCKDLSSLSGKAQKAHDIGIDIMSIDDFRKMLDE
jgi:DNA ligase (NAD+)